MSGNDNGELDTLVPPAVELTLGGEAIAIRPLRVGQVPAFLRAIGPVMQKLTAPGIDWLALFAEDGEQLLNAMAIATGMPRSWVDNLAADEAILLAAQVIEVNADFFTRVVAPRLNTVFAPVAKAAGSMPSSG